MTAAQERARRCRYCAHFDLGRVLDKAGRVRRDRMAQCLFDPSTILVTMPESWRTRHIINLSYMSPDDGRHCPQFSSRPADTAGNES